MELDFLPRTPPATSRMLVSVIIPTHNSAQHIAHTLESVLSQEGCRIEVLVIDANSTDHTLSVVHSFDDERIRVQKVPSPKTFEMINRGLALAQGEYVQILRPGDAYLLSSATSFALWRITSHNYPDLFYSASWIRDEWGEPHLLFRPLESGLLKKGMQPTIIQACWIKREVFKKIGCFNTDLHIRSPFDFFARFLDEKTFTSASEERVYIEPAIVYYTYPYLFRIFTETFTQISKYYGVAWACAWTIRQRYLVRFLHKVMRRCKWAFSGKS